jgi:acyl-CoA thioesterase I
VRLGWIVLFLLLLGLVIVIYAGRDRPPGLPQDRQITLSPGIPTGPLRITLLGTSLTALPDWPDQLAEALGACLSAPVVITRVAAPGRAIDWGLTQLDNVVASHPDIVLVEFAINDSDLRDGLRLSDSADMHRTLIAGLRQNLPDVRIALMTMSPAEGIRGWLRPYLAAHVAQYRVLAATQNIGLVDLYPRWLALPSAARGLARDGLHPAPEIAAQVILPVLVPYIARAAGITCAG